MSDFHTETRTYAGGSELPQSAHQSSAQQGTTQQSAAQQGAAQQVRQAAQETAHEARTAAGEVAVTAKDQARTVAHEAREQTRHVLHQLRRHTDEQARQQSTRAAGAIRQWTGELEAIGDNAKPDSPMRGVVQQVAEQGHRAADYLETEGLPGAVRDVQDFARRRPGLFLAGALVAGFLVGRAVKAVASAEDPHTDHTARRPGTGTPYGTSYGTSYGTAGDGGGPDYGSGSPSSTPYGTRPPTTTYGTGTGGPGTGVTGSPPYGDGTGYQAGRETRDDAVPGDATGHATGARYPSEEIRDGRADRRADGYPGTPGDGSPGYGGGPR